MPTRQTRLRGRQLLADPALNKGTAFSPRERRELGLEGLLPEAVETLETQVARTWACFGGLGSDLEKFRFAQALRRTNSTLFHRFLADHIDDLLPIVYTPTVGAAIQRFSLDHQSPSGGVYLACSDQPRLEEVLRQAAAGGAVDLILVTDAEGILGIGDQGIGGIEICLGKLAVYTLCAGFDPQRLLPVVLDVGTNRQSLIDDPLYPGCRQPRLQGSAYDAFIAAFVAAVQAVFPGALLHWEDFGVANAHRNLATYRHQLPSFNDDIQGTRGVACAVVLAASRGAGVPVEDHRIVVFGAGTAGCGIAEGLVRLLQRSGLSEQQARGRLWLIDREGLLLEGQTIASPLAARFARSTEEVSGFERDADGRIGLLEVVSQVRPTVLIGTSTVAGAFSRAVVERMAAAVEKPIILPLSNPTQLAEATPADLLAWTGGRALVATGSPFAPVLVDGLERRIGQCNNCFLYPGLGFAAVAVGAREVSEAMVDAALEALAERIPGSSDPTAPLMPTLAEVGSVARAVAEAVAKAAVNEGLARLAATPAEAIERLDQASWEPVYGAVEAV
ncbi:oxaloacetate-decarboxylating malate dehydrogenase [Synechococcus sp. CS-1325]|uniref:oxaloacetate-decarboxylating malate dehydrogenase n=1 Tax=Synechococcus sp. CS-1325 TaxID=2847979 RepID=UPI000DB7F87F|nr:oxaloacetate-decarboxylating malate dehydrogenase [Synechococcus sp. CS-1325]MCT0200546.1 oxaloacetate-decarboxylating malate dehydrogenase [Synechococcus sp. CS-1325]PZU96909.1 MAG: malic enzyme [Cyanobium sp.]